jgi:penicillin-binding protein 1A
MRLLVSKHPNVVRVAAGVGFVLVLLSGWFLFEVATGLPEKDQLRGLAETVEGTTLYDAHDRPVFALPTRYRIEVPLNQISANLQKAIVAVEDARFYEHDGIDGVRLIGAVITDLRERRAAEGASTITQQLARLSFLTRDKTLRRKVREAILAQRIERLYSKDEILEIYLNKVYFGDGLYGAEAASEGYFGKKADQLSIAEGALLAGVVKAPSATNPVASLDRAIERRNLVLRLMREHKFIDAAEYDAAVAEKVALKDTLRHEDPAGIHYKEVVRRQLIQLFGQDAVYRGKLQVYTAFDPEMQKAAEQAVKVSLSEIDRRIKNAGREPLQGALIALDPRTGEVRAIIGGRDTDSVGLNRALQTRRQPGSAFKPFVYAAALESGYTPATIIDQLDTPVDTLKGAWLPEDEHSTAESMTMRAALRTSSNRAAVRMLEVVGIDRTVAYARQLGVGTVPNVPSLALGSGEVTLASMTAAYAGFAEAGVVRDPIFIRRVTDHNGEVLYQGDPKPRRAVSESTAFLMASMLADVIDFGTANRARAMGLTRRAAGKTGTTNDFMDAWFVGFTPNLVAGVWVGFDQPRTIIKNGFAGQLAVPMWTRFMKEATRNDRDTWFSPPADVTAVKVCRVSGNLPGPNCERAASVSATGEVAYKNMVYTEYFVRGTEPRQTCVVHAFEYLPYPEPYFTATPLDDIGIMVPSLERATDAIQTPPLPVPTSSTPSLDLGRHTITVPASPPASPPAPARNLPDLPRAEPERPPAPPQQTEPAQLHEPPPQDPGSALPPAAPPEAPPAAVQ